MIVLLCLKGVFAFEFWLTKRQHTRTFIVKKPKEYDGIATDEEYTKSRLYSQDRLSFAITHLIFSTTLTFLLLKLNIQKYLWDLSLETLSRWVSRPAALAGQILPSVAFFALQLLISTVTELPFSVYSTFWIEHKHGFNKMGLKTFIADTLKGLVISVLFGLPLTALFIWVMERTYNSTFLYLWLLALLLQILIIHIYPVVIQPLFNKLVPLEEGDLKDKINQLATRLNFPLSKVYVMDGSKRSSHSNAYFYGIFRSKHIVIFDTLINQCTTDEIVSILGHELGHWKYNHFLRRFAVAQAHLLALFVGFSWLVRSDVLYQAFGFSCPAGPSSSASSHCKPIVVGSMLFSILMGPFETVVGFLMNCQSRVHEYEADQFACENGLGSGLKNGLVKLLLENKSNMNPDPLYSAMNNSHPTVLERIQRISKYE